MPLNWSYLLQLMIILMNNMVPESVELCSENVAINNETLFLITFGCGSSLYSNKTPADFYFSTTYELSSTSVGTGKYSFVNAVPKHEEYWHDGALDHTENDTGGYMYLIDVGEKDSHIFDMTVNHLSIGLCYQFSAYLANINIKDDSPKPNVRFEVRNAAVDNNLLAQFNTSEIPTYKNMTWSKHDLLFIASNSSVILLLISNVGGNHGNDLAIDDIELSVCKTNHSGYGSPETTSTSQQASTITLTMNENPTEPLSTSVSTTKTLTRSLQKNSTLITTSIMVTTQMITAQQTSTSPSQRCDSSLYIGRYCNVSIKLCDMLKPCQKNNGICHNTDNNQRYTCTCPSGFNGTDCEFDYRPCKPHTCLYHGICNETSNTTFNCTCHEGWQGRHCESMINFCKNNTCLNRGVCRPLVLNYTCECLYGYSGRHCQITAMKIIIYRIVAKSFAYVVIVAIASVAMFVIIMDILKYCFGIDPVEEERRRLRREKRAKRAKRPVIQRFNYVNAPSKTSVT